MITSYDVSFRDFLFFQYKTGNNFTISLLQLQWCHNTSVKEKIMSLCISGMQQLTIYYVKIVTKKIVKLFLSIFFFFWLAKRIQHALNLHNIFTFPLQDVTKHVSSTY